MELSFVSPWFLPALALAVLPFLVHLHSRTAARRVDFPAAVLLFDSGEEITRMRRLRELMVLVARMVLIGTFVLCVARPVVKGAYPSRPPRKRVACAILVDDSVSMLARGPGGTRLARAKALAREVVAQLEAGSELLVVTFSGRRFGPSPDLGEGLGNLRSIEATFVARGPEDALAEARAFAELSALPAEAYLLSDFEHLGRERPPGLADAALILSILDERDPDDAVLGVRCPQRRVYPGVPFTLLVETRLEGPSLDVVLELGGREYVAPAEDARFRLVLDEPGVHVGKIELRNESDAVEWDDSFHLVLNVCRPPRVACFGRDAEVIQRALRPGADVPVLATASVATEGSDCAFVTSPMPRETWEEIERAAVPAVVLGPALDDAAPCPSPLLPFSSAGSRSFGEPATLILSTPVPGCLEVFLDGRNGDLSSVVFARARVAKALGAEEGAFFTADAHPALLLWERGAAFLGGVSTPWSQFSSHPAFVPFVHELVAHACGLFPPLALARVSEPVRPPSGLRAQKARLPGGASVILGERPVSADRPGACVFFGDRGEWGAAVNCVEEIPAPAPAPAGRDEHLAELFRARELHVTRGCEELLAAMARARAGVEVSWLPFLVAGLFLIECALSARWRGKK